MSLHNREAIPARLRRVRHLALALALVAMSGCATDEGAPRLPDGIAALGDSISRAMNVVGEAFGDQPAHAWATGTDPNDGVMSHYERLRSLDGTLDIVAFNDARSGARMSDLAAQATEATRQRAQYVVLLLGANDVCAGTPADAFRAQLDAGANILGGLDAEVLVASVPDVTQLAELFAQNKTARAVWLAYDVCPRVLAEGADVEAARALARAYNDALREVAAERGWTWDGGAVSETIYEAGDVSEIDYFHPSLAGQARLAEVTWGVGPYSGWRG